MSSVCTVCTVCGSERALVDEHARCEACVFAAYSRACTLSNLEYEIESLLDGGLSAEQLHEVLDLMIENREGSVALVRRELVTTRERVIWREPDSAFLDEEEDAFAVAPNRIGQLAGPLESLAERVGVEPTEVALWKQGVTPPRWAAEKMSEMWGISVCFLLRCESDECARCRTQAPGTREARDEEGWTVARGEEFICGGCVTPADLDW